jgi:recombination protein RecA
MSEAKKDNISGLEGKLDEALKFLRKEYGDDVIYDGEMKIKQCKVISTGCFALDLALGVGGLPRGRLVEIFGPEGCGKTTLAMHVVAEAQKAGGKAAFIDAEHALDPIYAKAIGVDVDNLYFSQPSCGEEALSVAEVLAASKEVDVIVVDSVAALVPRSELLGTVGDSGTAASIAQLMSKGLRRIVPRVNKSDTLVIFINQIREKIGVRFGNPETTPGGRALKFFSSVRIDVRKQTSMKDITQGTATKAKVIKNKVASPFKIAEFDIIYGMGIDNYSSILDMAVANNLVHKSGSHYIKDDLRLGNGREVAATFLRENEDISGEILEQLKTILLPTCSVENQSDTE